MPCHGDQGQGLTDEFRALWVEDHQNCWARGCHGGKKMDEGFPIPTFVPPIAGGDQLARFDSEQELYDYLRATHPPQYPGRLEEDEYRAIAFIVFWMNHRTADSPMPLPESTLTSSLFPPNKETLPRSPPTLLWTVAIVAALTLATLVLLSRNRRKGTGP
jgi:hypothetical protein